MHDCALVLLFNQGRQNVASHILQDACGSATIMCAQQHAYHYGQRQQRSQKGSQKAEEGKAQASARRPQELGWQPDEQWRMCCSVSE